MAHCDINITSIDVMTHSCDAITRSCDANRRDDTPPISETVRHGLPILEDQGEDGDEENGLRGCNQILAMEIQ